MAELKAATDIIGYDETVMLGYRDSGMPGTEANARPDSFAQAPLDEAVGRLVAVIRRERPQVILTYPEDQSGYPHPDHIKTHEVSVEAFEAAADPDRYPGAGDPWQPLKLYYFATFHKARFTALHEGMVRRGLESPYAERLERAAERAEERPELEITTRVQCADFFGLRDQALIAHATQIDPDSSWFACPLEVQRAAWPTEDYHLARSVVDTERPEDDLFAGVRERVSL